MKIAFLLFLTVVSFSQSLSGRAIDDMSKANQLIHLKEQIADAIYQYDKQVLIEALDQLNSWTNDEKWQGPVLYYKAYIHYRLSTLFEDEIEQDQDELIEQAADWLKLALSVSEDQYKADMYALLSSCYGILIGGPFSAMNYGPKAQEAMDKAKQFGPANPRVYLLDGIGKMYTPAMFGGGLERAERLFQQSQMYFEQERDADAPLIAWGQAEIFVWIGRLREQKGEYQRAQAAYQRALSIVPNYKWITDKLLPEVTQKIKTE
jgi:tetratricopeptide (TPR) repeat protein